MIILVKCCNDNETDSLLKSLDKTAGELVVNEYPIFIRVDTKTHIWEYIGQHTDSDHMNTAEAIDVINGVTLARFNAGKPKWGIADLRMFTSMMTHMEMWTASPEYSDIMVNFSELIINPGKTQNIDSLVASLYSYGCEKFDYRTKDRRGASITWDNIEFSVIEDLIAVLELGEKKYDRDNWKNSANLKDLTDSLGRHIKYMRDTERDSESNLYHYAHALCNCMFMFYHVSKSQEIQSCLE